MNIEQTVFGNMITKETILRFNTVKVITESKLHELDYSTEWK